MASTSASASGLSLLLGAPSRDTVAAIFDALFQQRQRTEEAQCAAVQALLPLPPAECQLLAHSAGSLLRRVLYESSEVHSTEAVLALLPAELDSRLKSLLATVRVQQ